MVGIKKENIHGPIQCPNRLCSKANQLDDKNNQLQMPILESFDRDLLPVIKKLS